MNGLIQNGYFSRGESSTGTRLCFEGGEYYEGEVYRGLPRGEGSLHLADGSVYSGVFDESGIISGEFRHFSGVKFEGSFLREKFSKGTLKFIDGEELRGVWGAEGNAWVLKSGEIVCEKGIEEVPTGLEGLRRGGKTIFSRRKQAGFEVVWDRLTLANGSELLNFSLGAEGLESYERKEGRGSLVRVSRRCQLLVAFDQVDKLSLQGSPLSSVAKLALGLSVETPRRGSQVHRITFASHPRLLIEGSFEHSKARLKIVGSLLVDGQYFADFRLKKTLMKPLEIKVGEKPFHSIADMIMSLPKKEQASSESLKQVQDTPKPSKMGPSVLKMMIHALQKGTAAEQKTVIATSA